MPTTPPECLRSVLDGSSEPSVIVLSTGLIWHVNEPARHLFHINNSSAGSVWTYLSFSRNNNLVQLSWDDVTTPESYINNRRSVDGIGMPHNNGENFPVVVNMVRVSSEPDSNEDDRLRSGEPSASETTRRLGEDEVYYCLHIREQGHGESAHLSEMKDAIIRASGQHLVVIDNEGIIQSMSDGFSQIFGYAQDDNTLIGRNVNVLLQGGNQILEEEANNNQREVLGIQCDGSIIDLEIGFARMASSNNIAIMVKDITERKERHRRELNDKIAQDLEERSQILEASFDPMFCTNPQGTILRINQAVVDEFGWERDELIGQNISVVVGGHHQQYHDSYIKRYNETKEKRMIGKQREIRCLRKDGTEFSSLISLAEIPTGFCGVIQKTTLQKIHERNISQAEQKLAAELKNQKNITSAIMDACKSSMCRCLQQQFHVTHIELVI